MVKQGLLDLDKSEKVLIDIKRHPIGIYVWYLFGTISVILTLLTLYFLVQAGTSDGEVIDSAFYTGIFSFLVFVFVIMTVIGVHVYKQNEFVVTNENIIQILQHGLLNKQVSQLNLAKIQDVSVDQVGIFQTFFNYGTLEIETAGEASNFSFKFTRDPNMVAKTVIEAHENFMKVNHGIKDGI